MIASPASFLTEGVVLPSFWFSEDLNALCNASVYSKVFNVRKICYRLQRVLYSESNSLYHKITWAAPMGRTVLIK